MRVFECFTFLFPDTTFGVVFLFYFYSFHLDCSCLSLLLPLFPFWYWPLPVQFGDKLVASSELEA